jgi:outer membrane protein, heavy metal efflux system
MCAIIWFLLLSSSIFAQGSVENYTQPGSPGPNRTTAADTRQTLSLDDALSLAEQHNPQLKVSAALVEGAEGAVLSAKARPNPNLTVGSLGYQRAIVQGSVPGMLHGFTINQPVELPQLRRTRINTAEIGRESSLYALSETRLAIRGSVKLAFYEALRRNREVELTRGNLRLLEDLRRRIEIQVNVGEAARLELTRADAEVAAARIQVQSAELRRSAALSALYAAVGTPLGDVDLRGSLAQPATLPPLETLLTEILGAHPAIALAESETRRAAAYLEHQKAQRTPQPTVWAEVFRQPDVAQYRYGVSVDLPFLNRRQGQIAEAVAAHRQATAAAGQRRLEITATLERTYSLYQIAGRQVEMFETGTLRLAETAFQAAEAAFRLGERSILEVLDAQRVLRSARQDYLNAQFDRQQALIELEQLRASDFGGRQP